jgi:hypothetical protein
MKRVKMRCSLTFHHRDFWHWRTRAEPQSPDTVTRGRPEKCTRNRNFRRARRESADGAKHAEIARGRVAGGKRQRGREREEERWLPELSTRGSKGPEDAETRPIDQGSEGGRDVVGCLVFASRCNAAG